MTDELAISESHNYAFDMFTQAQSEVRKLNIPNKQAVIDLCQASMRMLASQLADNDFAGANDTLNKMDAFERYMRSIPKTHADYTWNVNKMADTHVRGLRDTGKTLNKHMAAQGANIDKVSPATKKPLEPIIWRKDLQEKYNISPQKYDVWKQLSDISDDQFEAYIAPYLDGGVEKGMILYWSNLYSHFKPPAPKTTEELPIAMTPAIAAVYRAARDLKDALNTLLEELSNGKTPIGQVRYLFNYLKDIPQLIVDKQKHSTELYR